MVKLYTRDISDLYDGAWRDKLALIPPERRKRAQNMRKDHDSARSVGAWLLLRDAMSAEGVDIDKLTVTKNEYGKPKIDGAPEFSISHAGQWAVVAVSDSPVGVDVESARCTIEMAERFFTASELEGAEKLSGDAQTLYLQRLWVCNEAFVKALGTGLYTPFSAFNVVLDGGGAELEQNLSPLPFRLIEYPCGDFRIAVCGLGTIIRA
ncbi:MAG: 4'-phosphopantetheinyl transferase superfamily protein [Oscillospiraceae bacterium]|nr:4'-phosphopantetheinyl transferase superfamily protein [Oscillospiraceae bacterium]